MIRYTRIALGADSPEMQAVERLLKKVGVEYAYAIGPDGQRVRPDNAHAAVCVVNPYNEVVDPVRITHSVECEIAGATRAVNCPTRLVGWFIIG